MSKCYHECICPDYSFAQSQLNVHAQGKPCEKSNCRHDSRKYPVTIDYVNYILIELEIINELIQLESDRQSKISGFWSGGDLHIKPVLKIIQSRINSYQEIYKYNDIKLKKYCPNCNHFRDLQSGSRQNPPLGKLTPEMLEDEKGAAKYGCYCSTSWIDTMPMKVIDIQLLRGVGCNSFMKRSV